MIRRHLRCRPRQTCLSLLVAVAMISGAGVIAADGGGPNTVAASERAEPLARVSPAPSLPVRAQDAAPEQARLLDRQYQWAPAPAAASTRPFSGAPLIFGARSRAARSAHSGRGERVTAKLLIPKRMYRAPGGRGAGTLPATQYILGGPTVTPVYEQRTRAGVNWLLVGVPGRPNGRRRWITEDGVSLGQTPYRIVVDLSARSMSVIRKGRTVRRLRVVIGKPGTETPTGSFFVTESVKQPRSSVIGAWVLALSGYSNRLTEFAGGKGQVAIHGIGKLNARPGQAASFGCVRVTPGQLNWLVARIGPGVPVLIRR